MAEGEKSPLWAWVVFGLITVLNIVVGVLPELLKNITWFATNLKSVYIGVVVGLWFSTCSAWWMFIGWRRDRKRSIIAERDSNAERQKFKEAKEELDTTKIALNSTDEILVKAIAQSKKYNVIKEGDSGSIIHLRGLLQKSVQQLAQAINSDKLAGLDNSLKDIAFLSSFSKDVDKHLLEYMVDLKEELCKEAKLVTFHLDLKTINEEMKIMEGKGNCQLRATHISQIFDPIIICGADVYLKYNDRWLYLGDEEFGRLSITAYREFLKDLYESSIAVTYDKKHDYLGQVSKKLSRDITNEINRNGFAPCAYESGLWLLKAKEYPRLFDQCEDIKKDITQNFEDFEVGITGKSSKIVACWPLTHRGLKLRLHEYKEIRDWLERLKTTAKNNPGLEVQRYLFISGKRDIIKINGNKERLTVLDIPDDYPNYENELKTLIHEFFPNGDELTANYRTYVVLTDDKLIKSFTHVNDDFDKVYRTAFGQEDERILDELASNWIFFFSPGLSVLQYEDLVEIRKGDSVKLLPVFYYQDTDIDLTRSNSKKLDIERKCNRYLIYVKTLEQYRKNIYGKDPTKNTSLYLFGLYEPGSPFYGVAAK